MASGQVDRQALSLVGQLADDDGGLERYQKRYLPDEICVWGGDLREMFPRTCEGLCDVENAFSEFFTFWFREPRATKTPFDYFLVKIYLFVEFDNIQNFRILHIKKLAFFVKAINLRTACEVT